MQAELAEVRDFLAAHAPFSTLPHDVLERLPRALEVRYARRGSVIVAVGERSEELYIVRSGAVEVRDEAGRLLERCEPGEWFGVAPLLDDAPSRHRITALEDTLYYALPKAVFEALRRDHPAFARAFDPNGQARLAAALAAVHTPHPLLTVRVNDLLTRPPVAVAPRTSIREAARLMAEEGISSLLVMEMLGEKTRLVGILTDRDLRNRVVAAGRDPEGAVTTIMTPDPEGIDAEDLAFEALLAMTRRNVHHLPVWRSGRVVGLVSATDLMRLETASPVYLVGDIAKQTDLAGLVAISRGLHPLFRRLVEADATAADVGRVMTLVGDALERRLLELAEAELGPPPVPYCWLVLGSQARLERTAQSDQDNALLLADEAAPEHDTYFAKLAAFVSDGLAACGYPYCPGGVMASRWRMSASRWRATFAAWIETPKPEALLNSTIFFDMRGLHGELELAERLREEVLEMCRHTETFLAYLAKTALEHTPPLGFFRGFVLERDGEHAHTLDLKLRGVAPIVDLARVYALAQGVAEVNTHARLAAAAEARVMSAEGAADLQGALEFIGYIRLRHQARQLAAGRSPDNFVAPEELSPLERRHLKDAFRVVRAAQTALEGRYPLRFLA